MSTLSLRTTADGRPSRLVFVPIHRGAKMVASALPGANSNGEDVTFPADPQVVQMLGAEFEDLEMDDDCCQWFRKWQTVVGEADAIKHATRVQLPIAWQERLYDYQTVGAEWLATVKKGILADDMGIGKTRQALAACDVVGAQRVLVVAPNGTSALQWERAIADLNVSTCTIACGDGKEERTAALATAKSRFIIVTHPMLRVKPAGKGKRAEPAYPALLNQKWDVVIVDEAHRLQSRKSQQSTGAGRLACNHLFLLTGTPIWNKPDSLWHLLHLIDPRRFSSYWAFVDAYCHVVRMPWGNKIMGASKSKLPELKRLIAPLILRRTEDDPEVNIDLPPVIHEHIEYELPPTLRKVYDKTKKELKLEWDDLVKNYGSMAAAMSKLRMLCSAPSILEVDLKSPKEELLTAKVEDHFESGHQSIVFCWHKAYAEHLGETLQATLGTKDHPPVVGVCSGDYSDVQRMRTIQAFTEGKLRVIVATISTLGEAVDLYMARAVFFAELDWTPAINKQAWKRAHRIGQKYPVHIYTFAAHKTVEANVYHVAMQKSDLAEEVLALREVGRAAIFDDL